MSAAFRLTAGLTLAGAVACSTYVAAGAGLDGPDVARVLATHRAVPYAVALWWVMLAPLPLLLAALVSRWTRWPWAGVVTVHLATLAAGAARLQHLVPDLAWVGLGAVVVVGVASTKTAFDS